VIGAAIAAVLIALSSVALLVAALTPTGIPNFVARAEESRTHSLAHRGMSRTDVIKWLSEIHANWHQGESWQYGESLGGFSLGGPCRKECGSSLQVAFERTYWFCAVSAEVITFRFGADGHLISSQSVPAVDGC